jgi:hypothetical protein
MVDTAHFYLGHVNVGRVSIRESLFFREAGVYRAEIISVYFFSKISSNKLAKIMILQFDCYPLTISQGWL